VAAADLLPRQNRRGCRRCLARLSDSFRFVPDRDDADIAITPGASATITLVNLPPLKVMVGDLNARVAYASLSSTTTAMATVRSTFTIHHGIGATVSRI